MRTFEVHGTGMNTWRLVLRDGKKIWYLPFAAAAQSIDPYSVRSGSDIVRVPGGADRVYGELNEWCQNNSMTREAALCHFATEVSAREPDNGPITGYAVSRPDGRVYGEWRANREYKGAAGVLPDWFTAGQRLHNWGRGPGPDENNWVLVWPTLEQAMAAAAPGDRIWEVECADSWWHDLPRPYTAAGQMKWGTVDVIKEIVPAT